MGDLFVNEPSVALTDDIQIVEAAVEGKKPGIGVERKVG